MGDKSSLSCPVPLSRSDRIQLAHGGGGTMMQRLLSELIVPRLVCEVKNVETDSALLEVQAGRLAFTSDGYVVTPRFFPGGDIGKLAVYGTVNDLAMVGATPRALSVSLILEEGLELAELDRILRSMREAADECAVSIVTGDTKVVERGKADGVFIATSGVGVVPDGILLGPDQVQANDALILSGDVGRHGIAVLAARNQFQFQTAVESDAASLFPAVSALLRAQVKVRFLRDATRGGLSSLLNELSHKSRRTLEIDEASIPIHPEVLHVCELLGLDPLHIASEGRMLIVVSDLDAPRALEVLRTTQPGLGASRIGQVKDARRPSVHLRTRLGSERLLYPPEGEQLPRIC